MRHSRTPQNESGRIIHSAYTAAHAHPLSQGPAQTQHAEAEGVAWRHCLVVSTPPFPQVLVRQGLSGWECTVAMPRVP